MPVNDEMRTGSYIRKLDLMINEVNKDEVEETDVLSDHAYIYRRDSEKIDYKLFENPQNEECT